MWGNPKRHNTGKFRLTTDLSFPPDNSVNDGIDSDLCSMAYTTVDQVAAQQGRGALSAKVDIESAYRLIPVHPHDCPLLGMKWKGNIYIDPMLPFRLRSPQKSLTWWLHWHLQRLGIKFIHHYLDDYTILEGPLCQQWLNIFRERV